jgi:tetratricopeptide (TPR) repeat protein
MAKITGLIKRAAISLILIAVFCLLAIAIVRPLLAGIKASEATALIKQYKWAQADEALRRAIGLDPSNASYYAKLGDFIFAQSSYGGYKEPAVRQAEKLYRSAIELDPREAEYWLKLGRAQVKRMEYIKALEYFRKGYGLDPYGYNTAFYIGTAGIEVWKNIGDADRNFIIGRLGDAVKTQPWNADGVYMAAWRATKDYGILYRISEAGMPYGRDALLGFTGRYDLWRERSKWWNALPRSDARLTATPETAKALMESERRRIDGLKRSLKPAPDGTLSASDWTGATFDGKNIYRGGAMYWSGRMDALIENPPDIKAIKLRMKGQKAAGTWPYAVIELDGEAVGEIYVDGEDWKEYEIKVSGYPGLRVLSVFFTNDYADGKEDRNLYVDSAEVARAGK